jgi:hypothetical protein
MSYVRSAFLENITSGTKILALDYVDKTTT